MTIQGYGYFNTTSNSNPSPENSSQNEKNDLPSLFEINNDPFNAPSPPLPNLQEREITVKKEQDLDFLIIEDEEFNEIKVKKEPGLELPTSKELLSITKVRERIKLINPNYDYDLEIGVENCLPCVISFYNWILSGSDFPEAVDPYAKPLHEHMFPINDTACLLQDPLLENLHNPKEVNALDSVGGTKEYICLTEDLPLTFKSVKLTDLKTKIESKSVAWQQYEKGGETFKLGILFLNHRDDESKAHFLAFEYKKTSSNLYTLYITDPQSGNVLTFAQFLKDYRYSYADTVKIWSGQNKINYNCNQTVKEMFETLKVEKKESHSSSDIESNEKKKAGADTKLKISVKRKRPTEDESLITHSKQKLVGEADQSYVNISPKPAGESAWARIAKMVRADSLNTIDLTEDLRDEAWEKEMMEIPSKKVPQSTSNWLENRKKSADNPKIWISDINLKTNVVEDSIVTASDNNVTHNKVMDHEDSNSTSKNQLNSRDCTFLFDDPPEAELSATRVNTHERIDLNFNAIKHAADLGDAEQQWYLGCIYLKGTEEVLQDLTLAFTYMKLAADRGLVDAQYNLGNMYFTGLGEIFQELSLAFKYLKLAADQGHAKAQFKVGNMFLEGKVVPLNHDEGLKYCTAAADQGFIEAQLLLAKIHNYDHKLAFGWYQLAADQGNILAQSKVGDMYYEGRGVRKNFANAKNYYELAANQGDEHAKNMLVQISRADIQFH